MKPILSNYTRFIRLAAVLVGSMGLAGHAQTKIDLRSQSKAIDFSAAASTRPVKTGVTLPGVCQTGELFFKNDAPVGLNLFGCAGDNTWALLGDGAALPGAGNTTLDTLTVAKVNQTMLTVGAACSPSTPCLVRFGSQVFAIYSGATVSLTGGSGNGAAKVYISQAGVVTIDRASAAGVSINCTSCTALTSADPSVPSGAIPLADVNIQSGAWGTVTDTRAFLSTKPVAAGQGIQISESGGVATINVNTAEVGRQSASNTFSGTNTFTGSNDFSNAASLVIRKGGSDPGACIIGELFYNTSSGLTKQCTAANTWSSINSGGGGVTFAYTPARTSATVLSLPATPDTDYRVGNRNCPSIGGSTFTLSGTGTGTLWIALGPDCGIKVRHNVSGACSANCTPVGGSTGYASGDLPLYEWPVSSGALASSGTNRLAKAGGLQISAGAGITLNTTDGVTSISVSGANDPVVAGAGIIVTKDQVTRETTIELNPAYAPTLGGTNGFAGANDFSAAASTKPMKIATSDPAFCNPGEFLFRSDISAIRVCTAANVWNTYGNGSGAIYLPVSAAVRYTTMIDTLAGYTAAGSNQGIEYAALADAASHNVTWTIPGGGVLPSNVNLRWRIHAVNGSGTGNARVQVTTACVAAPAARDAAPSLIATSTQTVNIASARGYNLLAVSGISIAGCYSGTLFVTITRLGSDPADTLADALGIENGVLTW